MSVTSTLIFHHQDHLGSTAVDTDEEGNIIQLLDYYPYGSVRVDEQSSTYTNPYTYTGKELDEPTNQYYFEARYYNPTMHRFTGQDPLFWTLDETYLLDPQQWNSYAYSRNNPVRFIDETGEKVSEYQPYVPPHQNGSYQHGDLLGEYRTTPVYSGGKCVFKWFNVPVT